MAMFMMIELLMSAYAIYQLQSRCIKMLHFVEQLITPKQFYNLSLW
mgnify:CR=1 FL=1